MSAGNPEISVTASQLRERLLSKWQSGGVQYPKRLEYLGSFFDGTRYMVENGAGGLDFYLATDLPASPFAVRSVRPSGRTDDTDAQHIENALSTPVNVTVALVPGASYNINRPIIVKNHGAYLINPFALEGRVSGDQPTATPAPRPPLLNITSTFPNNTGTVISWGDLTSGVVWNSGGIIGVEINCHNAAGDNYSNYGIENHNVHSFRMVGTTIENALLYQTHFDSNISGGTSNHKIRDNLFRIIGTSQSIGAGFFGEGLGWGQSWLEDNFFSGLFGYSLIATGINDNRYLNNYFEGTRVGTGGQYKAGTAMWLQESGINVEGNESNGSDYFGIYYAPGNGGIATFLNNTIYNPNGQSNADGAGVYLETNFAPVAVRVVENRIVDANNKMVYGVYANYTNGGALSTIIGPNTISGGAAMLNGVKIGAGVPAGSVFYTDNYGDNLPLRAYPEVAVGAGAAALGANSPAVTPGAPYTWLKVRSSDGSTVYIPCWK